MSHRILRNCVLTFRASFCASTICSEVILFASKSRSVAAIGEALQRFGFRGIQGSVYVCDSEDMANLFQAIGALNALPWFSVSVRDIRAFRIEQWSDFTPVMKGP